MSPRPSHLQQLDRHHRRHVIDRKLTVADSVLLPVPYYDVDVAAVIHPYDYDYDSGRTFQSSVGHDRQLLQMRLVHSSTESPYVTASVVVCNESSTSGGGDDACLLPVSVVGGGGGVSGPLTAIIVGLLSVLIVGMLVGNLLVILSVLIFTKMRSLSNILIGSLATADLLVAIFVLPISLHVSYLFL